MIREEIEKLRGYIFTKEELEEIIKPAIVETKEHLETKNEPTKEDVDYLKDVREFF